jgi:hypothetical protein
MSTMLSHPGSVVCVDDSQREIEAYYGLEYLGGVFSQSRLLTGTDMICYFNA